MKKSLSLALCAACALGASAATTVTQQILDKSVIYAGLVEIDINGDGILDMIYSGEVRDGANGRIVEDSEGNENQINCNTFQMVWNASTQSYDITEFPYYFGIKPYFAVTDFNGDGLTDFFAAGETSMVDGAQYGLFINKGDGTFERQAITVVDADNNVFASFDPRCVDWGDFNSDGMPDLVVSGWKNDANGDRQNYNYVLINQGDNKFLATNGELLIYGENGYEFGLNLLMATDLNNDGYADYLVQGNIDNAAESDKPLKNNKVMGRTFVAALNLGAETEGETVLYDLGLAEMPAHYYGHGGFEVADFNNDGVPDILVGGESPDDARGAGNFEFFWQLLFGRITNDGVSYTDATNSQIFANKDIRPLNDSKPFRVIDYNGNGLYDIILPGWCTTMLDGTDNTQVGWLFPNTNGTFPSYERIPGSSECAVFFTENGVSGVRNYGFLGQSWDGKYFNDETDIKTGRMLLFTTNPNSKAARPDAPTALSATVDGTDVTIEWTAASSSQANVTYEYYIKDVNTGKFYHGVPAFVGGDKDGVRTTIAQGRAFMAKKLTLVNIPDGTYEWGVQTVNANLEGSVFAKGQNFVVGNGGAGIGNINGNAAAVVATEYFDLMGRQLTEAPESGIVIKKEIREDGSNTVTKVIL